MRVAENWNEVHSLHWHSSSSNNEGDGTEERTREKEREYVRMYVCMNGIE